MENGILRIPQTRLFLKFCDLIFSEFNYWLIDCALFSTLLLSLCTYINSTALSTNSLRYAEGGTFHYRRQTIALALTKSFARSVGLFYVSVKRHLHDNVEHKVKQVEVHWIKQRINWIGIKRQKADFETILQKWRIYLFIETAADPIAYYYSNSSEDVPFHIKIPYKTWIEKFELRLIWLRTYICVSPHFFFHLNPSTKS